jgi:L-alanine-DL-glutamate epimerase-like enolase superfamily enzyme
MRITAIHDIAVPIASLIRNAYIDFSAMTASVVAVVTDARRDGRPVVGFGFNSNGRYAPQGLLRERFLPRLLAAKPEEIKDTAGLIDPAKAWAQMMRNEKPGGHGERSVAVGVLDMALWDAVAKAEVCRCGACSPIATTAAARTRPLGSTPPAATTTPART